MTSLIIFDVNVLKCIFLQTFLDDLLFFLSNTSLMFSVKNNTARLTM